MTDFIEILEQAKRLIENMPPAIRIWVLPVHKTPNKTLRRKSWMRGRCYQNRVQKKWTKRHGFKYLCGVERGQCILYKHSNTVMINPADRSNFERAFMKGGIRFEYVDSLYEKPKWQFDIPFGAGQLTRPARQFQIMHTT